MNNTILIGIIIAIIALIGGGYWFYLNTSTTADTEENTEENASVGRTFAQLFGSAQALECTYEFNDGKNVSEGTVYMTDSGARIRGDFNFTETGAGPMEMHMVRVGGYNYIWGSALPQGVKMQVTEENKGELFDSFGGQDVSAINNTEYHCEAWSGDSSKFVIPTDVQFMDMSSMMDTMKGASGSGEVKGSVGTPDIKAMQCAACDQAGPARDQCREALGCK